MQIIKESSYEIFNDFYSNGELIRKATEVYDKTKVTNNGTYLNYLQNLAKFGKTRLFEFAWYVVEIPSIEVTSFEYFSIINYYSCKKYLNCSIGEHGILISGNGRAWFELFQNELNEQLNSSICYALAQVYPDLFYFPYKKIKQVNTIIKDELLIQRSNDNMNNHDWLAVKFENISFALMEEFMQHRNMSFIKTSDRYAIMKDFNFMIDGAMTDNTVDRQKIEDCIKVVQTTYSYLINRGHKRDVIRQLLPLGVTGECIIAGTIADWKRLIKIQSREKSFWEAKLLMEDLKNSFDEIGY